MVACKLSFLIIGLLQVALTISVTESKLASVGSHQKEPFNVDSKDATTGENVKEEELEIYMEDIKAGFINDSNAIRRSKRSDDGFWCSSICNSGSCSICMTMMCNSRLREWCSNSKSFISHYEAFEFGRRIGEEVPYCALQNILKRTVKVNFKCN